MSDQPLRDPALLLDELEELGNFRRAGRLSDADFASKKTLAIVSAQTAARLALETGAQRKKAAEVRRSVAGALMIGLPLAFYGGYKLLQNQSIDEAAAVRDAQEAKSREFAGKRDMFGNPMDKSLFGAAERAMSATSRKLESQRENKVREERRFQALLLLVPGAILTLVGAAALVDRTV